MRGFIGALLLALASQVSAQAPAEEPAEVMLLGVFHFANPGRDMVKSDQINVMTDENQAWLEGLAERLAAFRPTAVLLEYGHQREDEIQARYDAYLAGEFELPSNEVYQIGFRVARLAGLKSVPSFDEDEVGWSPEKLFAYLPEHEPELEERFRGIIEQSSAEAAASHATKSLAELLLVANDPEKDRLNRSLYLMTNAVGAADGSFVGADATASWWHRNFRMYARVQHYARPGARVLVVGGQGHTAILKQLLDDDPDRIAVDVRPLLPEREPVVK